MLSGGDRYTLIGWNRQWSAALELLNRAIEINGKDVTAHCLLATTYMAMGQRSRAIHHCREVLKIDPDHEWAHRFLYGKEYKKFPRRRRFALRGPVEPEGEILVTP